MALSGGNDLAAAAVRSEIAAMKADLLSPNPGLVERILVNVVVVEYMAHQRAAAIAAQVAHKFRDGSSPGTLA